MTTPQGNYSQDPGSYDNQPNQSGYQPNQYSYQSNPYGSQPSYGQVLPKHPQETAILVLGIVGLFISICAVIALFMGNKARKEIAEGKYAPSSQITVGWVLGVIGTIFLVLSIVILVISVIAGVGAATILR